MQVPNAGPATTRNYNSQVVFSSSQTSKLTSMTHSRLEQRTTEVPAKLTIFTSNRELKSSMSGASKKPPRQPLLTNRAMNELNQNNPYGGIRLLPVTVEE